MPSLIIKGDYSENTTDKLLRKHAFTGDMRRFFTLKLAFNNFITQQQKSILCQR